MKAKKRARMIFRYFTYSKIRTAGIISVLSLAILGFILIHHICDDMIVIEKSIAFGNEGRQHFTIWHPREETIEGLKRDALVESMGFQYRFSTDIGGKQPLQFIYEDDAYAETYLQKRKITAGRMCREKNEIVVSEDYLSRRGFKVGDILHVNIAKEDMDSNKKSYEMVHDFVITGAADNLLEDAALVSMSFCDVCKSTPDNARVKLKSDSNIDSIVSHLVEAYHIVERIRLNEEFIDAIANEQKINGMKSTLELCMLLIAIMVCYYILNSNVNYKMKDMGIMRCLGFNTPEMIRILIDEMLCYVLLAILFGILISHFFVLCETGFMTRILGMKGNARELHLQTGLSINEIMTVIAFMFATIVPSCIKVIITMHRSSAVEVVRKGSRELRIKGNRGFSHFFRWSKMATYSFLNLQRNRKRTVFTVLLIATATILTCSIMSVIGVGKLDYSWVKMVVPGDVVVEEGMSMWEPAQMYPLRTKQKIMDIHGVANVKAILLKNCTVILHLDQVDKENSLYREYGGSNSREYGKNKNGEYPKFYIDGITAFGVENFANKYQCGKSRSHKINKNKRYSEQAYIKIRRFHRGKKFPLLHAVILKKFSKFSGLKTGDNFVVEVTYNIGGENFRQNLADVQVVDVIEENPPIGLEQEAILPHIYFDLSELEKFTDSKGANRFDVYLKKDAVIGQVLGRIRGLEEFQKNAQVTGYKEMLDTERIPDTADRNSEAMFIIILSFVTAIGCFDAIYTSIINRQNELMNLYRIGISKQEIRKSLLIESMGYAMLSWMIIVPVQVILVYLNWVNQMNRVNIDIELIIAYLIADIFVLVLCLCISGFSAGKILKRMKLKNMQCE